MTFRFVSPSIVSQLDPQSASMPPKKKSRVPPHAVTIDDKDAPSVASPKNPIVGAGAGGANLAQLVGEPVISDGWTDEQEITLFKAIAVYRWKPAGKVHTCCGGAGGVGANYDGGMVYLGMHKHFRMLAIEQMMRNHGVSDSHTNIEGIWRKLGALYRLEGIDERVWNPSPSPSH